MTPLIAASAALLPAAQHGIEAVGKTVAHGFRALLTAGARADGASKPPSSESLMARLTAQLQVFHRELGRRMQEAGIDAGPTVELRLSPLGNVIVDNGHVHALEIEQLIDDDPALRAAALQVMESAIALQDARPSALAAMGMTPMARRDTEPHILWEPTGARIVYAG